MKVRIKGKLFNQHGLERTVPDWHYLTLLSNEYGTLTGNKLSAHSGQECILTATPNEDCHFEDYEFTGGSLVGDVYTYGDEDGTVQANFGRNVHNITTLTSDYGSISVNKNTAYSGDIITITPTPNTDCSLVSYNITGSTATGNDFMMHKEDVSVQGSFARNKHNLTLQNDGHGTIAASKTTGYSGDTVTLSNSPNADYGFSNYTVTGATINGSTLTFGTTDATAKANFTAVPTSSVYYSNGSTSTTRGGNATLSISKAVTSFQYVTVKFAHSAYAGTTWAQNTNINFNTGSWNMRAHCDNGSYRPGYKDVRHGGTFTTANSNVVSNTRDGQTNWYYKSLTQGTNATYKFVIDRTNAKASAFLNNTYLGYGSVNTGITSVNSIYVSNDTNQSEVKISNVYVAGFKYLTAATAY